MRTLLIPPMITLLVQGALTALDGAIFDSLDACPSCGGPVSGYDTKQRQFARVTDEKGIRTSMVTVKRFRCRSCGRIVNADEPFYPNTRIGSPVIDLCIAFSRSFGYGRAARTLAAMGVAVDRMQCRHYAAIPVRPFPIMPMYGFPFPQSVLSLSLLTTEITEGGRVIGAEALAACGFPSADRTSLHLPGAGKERDERDKQKRDEER